MNTGAEIGLGTDFPCRSPPTWVVSRERYHEGGTFSKISLRSSTLEGLLRSLIFSSLDLNDEINAFALFFKECGEHGSICKILEEFIDSREIGSFFILPNEEKGFLTVRSRRRRKSCSNIFAPQIRKRGRSRSLNGTYEDKILDSLGIRFQSQPHAWRAQKITAFLEKFFDRVLNFAYIDTSIFPWLIDESEFVKVIEFAKKFNCNKLNLLIEKLTSMYTRKKTSPLKRNQACENDTRKKKIYLLSGNAFSSVRLMSRRIKAPYPRFAQHKKSGPLMDWDSMSDSLAGSPPESATDVFLSASTVGTNHKRTFIKRKSVAKRRFGGLHKVGASHIAAYLTHDLCKSYNTITIYDLLNEEKRRNSEGIKILQKKFNFISWWSVSFILQGDQKLDLSKNWVLPLGMDADFESKVQDRVHRLVFVLEIAHELRQSGNFHYFFAIMGALNQPLLDWLWDFSKEKSRSLFQTLNRAVKPDKNYLVHRADLSRFSALPHIPYLGFALRHLMALEMSTSDQIGIANFVKRYAIISGYVGNYFGTFHEVKDIRCSLNLVLELEKVEDVPSLDDLVELSRKEKEVLSNTVVGELEVGGFL